MEPKRIGLMLPSNNIVVEPEYYSLGLGGVTFHSDRLLVTSSSKSGLARMLRGVVESAQVIASFAPDAIAYCCLSSSLLGGGSWDKSLGERISKLAGGVPTCTAASAVIEALNELGLNKIATFSAYGPATNRMMLAFLAENGIRATSSRMLNLRMDEVGRLSLKETYERIIEMPLKDANGLLIGSTDLRVMSIIERLEGDSGIPVVSVNQAVLKSALAKAGIDARVPGYGRLLRGKRKQLRLGAHPHPTLQGSD